MDGETPKFYFGKKKDKKKDKDKEKAKKKEREKDKKKENEKENEKDNKEDREKESDKYSSDPSFYTLLMKCYNQKSESPRKHKPKRHLSSFTKIDKTKKGLSPAKKKRRNNVSQPKGQFGILLVKKFKLRNDFDKQHVDEFLSSKEQAFEFPSKDDDIIDD